MSLVTTCNPDLTSQPDKLETDLSEPACRNSCQQTNSSWTTHTNTLDNESSPSGHHTLDTHPGVYMHCYCPNRCNCHDDHPSNLHSTTCNNLETPTAANRGWTTQAQRLNRPNVNRKKPLFPYTCAWRSDAGVCSNSSAGMPCPAY